MKGDYANSRIYRLVCNDTGKQYYGSTTQSLAKRLYTHKGDFKKWQADGHKYMTSYEIIAGGNYDIVLVEECSDIKNIEQLRARERFHIEGNECVNKYIPGRTPKEHYVDNKEKIAAREAEYYAANKEQIRVKHSEYYAANKEQILVKQSEYNAAHKEEYNAYKREWHAKNKDRIMSRKAEKVTCPHCSSIVSRGNITTHQRSKKCLAAQDQDSDL